MAGEIAALQAVDSTLIADVTAFISSVGAEVVKLQGIITANASAINPADVTAATASLTTLDAAVKAAQSALPTS